MNLSEPSLRLLETHLGPRAAVLARVMQFAAPGKKPRAGLRPGRSDLWPSAATTEPELANP